MDRYHFYPNQTYTWWRHEWKRFRITVRLWGGPIGHRRVSFSNGQKWVPLMFLWCWPEQIVEQVTGDLRTYGVHVTLLQWLCPFRTVDIHWHCSFYCKMHVVFLQEKNQLPTSSSCREMIENVNIFYVSFNELNTTRAIDMIRWFLAVA